MVEFRVGKVSHSLGEYCLRGLHPNTDDMYSVWCKHMLTDAAGREPQGNALKLYGLQRVS